MKDDHDLKWFCEFAERSVEAQFGLGWCYENGKGVDQSYEEAVKWYSRATEQWETDMKYSLGVCYFIW